MEQWQSHIAQPPPAIPLPEDNLVSSGFIGVAIVLACFFAICVAALFATERVAIDEKTVQRGLKLTTAWVFPAMFVAQYLPSRAERNLLALSSPVILAWGFFLVKSFSLGRRRVRATTASALDMKQTREFPTPEFQGVVDGLPATLTFLPTGAPAAGESGGALTLRLDAPAPGAGDAVVVAGRQGAGNLPVEDLAHLPASSPAGWPAPWEFRGGGANAFARFASAPSPDSFSTDGGTLTRLRLKDGTLSFWIECQGLDPDSALRLAAAARAFADAFR